MQPSWDFTQLVSLRKRQLLLFLWAVVFVFLLSCPLWCLSKSKCIGEPISSSLGRNIYLFFSLTTAVLLFLSSPTSASRKHETSISCGMALRDSFFLHAERWSPPETCHRLPEPQIHSVTVSVWSRRGRKRIPQRTGRAIWVKTDETAAPLSLWEAAERPLPISHAGRLLPAYLVPFILGFMNSRACKSEHMDAEQEPESENATTLRVFFFECIFTQVLNRDSVLKPL